MTTEPKHGLKRYSNWCAVTHRHDLAEDANGNWVRAVDYDAMYETCLEELKACEALIAAKDAEIAGLREDAERGRWLVNNVFKYAVWIDLKRNDADELVSAIDAARSKQEKRDE
jgi:hypothetical protein